MRMNDGRLSPPPFYAFDVCNIQTVIFVLLLIRKFIDHEINKAAHFSRQVSPVWV